jgi:murein DD-endopeptidase MepM/ murein hydrolase activator NlpD
MASAAATTRDSRAPTSLNAQAAAIRPGAKPAAAAQAAVKPKPEPAKKAEVAKPAEKKVAEKKTPEKVAKADERKPAAEERRQVASAPAAAPAAEPAAVAEKPAADKPEFRWPARGRIIQGFKSGANEGINIAVPEGTQVKAAESGVVAYAGNELKGYGNLVLIRHPNGYVSAYAHNGEVAVKRGENVKRGQTIAKSGQTGNVASPQLHFELRKGSTPVDPTSYLAGL